jgi:hypothetical protein
MHIPGFDLNIPHPSLLTVMVTSVSHWSLLNIYSKSQIIFISVGINEVHIGLCLSVVNFYGKFKPGNLVSV